MEEIDYRSPILAQQKLERRIVSGLHVQHQLDVGPGHGLHIVSNPLTVKKLRFRGGCATWKWYLAGFLFLCHISARLYTFRLYALQKGEPLCLTSSLLWRPKDPSSWGSSSAWAICDPVPLPR